ncbi:MAG: RNA polymerase sigma factor, partial [Candidatus Dormibacteraceae bacterium]
AGVQDLVLSRVGPAGADFDLLVGPHLEAGYRTALAILRNPDEAHDAVQEAVFRAWRKLQQLSDGKAARPWFLAIVANHCFSTRRGRWWSVRPLPAAEVTGPEVKTEKIDVERALARLPREDRLALFLHFYLDLPLEEVGVVLGLSAAGAKTRVYRAAKKLRPGLEMD